MAISTRNPLLSVNTHDIEAELIDLQAMADTIAFERDPDMAKWSDAFDEESMRMRLACQIQRALQQVMERGSDRFLQELKLEVSDVPWERMEVNNGVNGHE